MKDEYKLKNKVTKEHLSEVLMLLERNDFIIVKSGEMESVGDIWDTSHLLKLIRKEKDYKEWFRFR